MQRRKTQPVILILIDGLGIGPPDTACNPLAHLDPRVLRLAQGDLGPLPHGGSIVPTEVQLGVAGRPQSATNHTVLLTGLNAPRRLGRHLAGFPNRYLRDLLAEHSIFHQVKAAGLAPAFANAYSDEFFERRPRWVSATTVMCESSRTPLFRMSELRNRKALYFDYSNHLLRARGVPVPERTSVEAASILAALSREYDLVLYEYFLTDHVGHKGDLPQAVQLLDSLDDFLFQLVEQLPPETSLVVTSDHGNIEDMTHSGHTENPVATLFWGPILANELPRAMALTRLCPLLVDFLVKEQA